MREVFFGLGLIVEVVINLLHGLIISPYLVISPWGVSVENENALFLPGTYRSNCFQD